MTRWLRAARGESEALTKPTELTEPRSVGGNPPVLSVKSVLSGGDSDEADDPACLIGDWEERAAIREYDGGQTRGVAEREAAREVALRGVPLNPSVRFYFVDSKH